MAPPFTTRSRAIVGQVGDLPLVPTRNPGVEKSQMVGHGQLGHVTNFALAHHPEGTSCGLHTHANMDEIFYVVGGTGIIEVDGVQQEAGPGFFAAIPCGAAHNLTSTSEGFQVLCLGIRARGFEPDDAGLWRDLTGVTDTPPA